MLSRCRLVFLATCLALTVAEPTHGGPPPSQAEKPPGKEQAASADRHGDPLPAGAVARLGTVRFRHGQWARCVAFSPDGKTVASGGEDRTIRLWDRATGKEIRRLAGHRSGVCRLAFTPDGKHLVSA